jgi:hypothetical protein
VFSYRIRFAPAFRASGSFVFAMPIRFVRIGAPFMAYMRATPDRLRDFIRLFAFSRGFLAVL